MPAETHRYAPFSISADALAYREGGLSFTTQPVWMDGFGREIGTVGAAGLNATPSLSPGETWIAVVRSHGTAAGLPIRPMIPDPTRCMFRRFEKLFRSIWARRFPLGRQRQRRRGSRDFRSRWRGLRVPRSSPSPSPDSRPRYSEGGRHLSKSEGGRGHRGPHQLWGAVTYGEWPSVTAPKSFGAFAVRPVRTFHFPP